MKLFLAYKRFVAHRSENAAESYPSPARGGGGGEKLWKTFTVTWKYQRLARRRVRSVQKRFRSHVEKAEVLRPSSPRPRKWDDDTSETRISDGRSGRT